MLQPRGILTPCATMHTPKSKLLARPQDPVCLTPDYVSSLCLSLPTSHTLSSGYTQPSHPHHKPRLAWQSAAQGVVPPSGQLPKLDAWNHPPWHPLGFTKSCWLNPPPVFIPMTQRPAGWLQRGSSFYWSPHLPAVPQMTFWEGQSDGVSPV